MYVKDVKDESHLYYLHRIGTAMTDRINFIDDARSACLCDVGCPGYSAALLIAPGGAEHLALIEISSIGDEAVRYDSSCTSVQHEQLGALPLDVVRRITISRRIHRCGRRTQAGKPCRIRVSQPGAVCEWHREQAALDLLAEQLGAKPINAENENTEQ